MRKCKISCFDKVEQILLKCKKKDGVAQTYQNVLSLTITGLGGAGAVLGVCQKRLNDHIEEEKKLINYLVKLGDSQKEYLEKVISVLQKDKERSKVMQISIIIIFFIIVILGGVGLIWSRSKNGQGSKRTERIQINSHGITANNDPRGLKNCCTQKENMEIIDTIEALAEIYKNDNQS